LHVSLKSFNFWVLFKLLNHAALDEKNFFAVGRNIIKEKFGLIYSIPSAGASIKWFAKNVMGLKSDMDLIKIINADHKKILEMQNNILFHPYLTGAWGPDFDPELKASFKNLEIGHTYRDIAKAIFEGVCFQLKKIVIEMEKNQLHFQEIKMVGGGSKSKIWPNILADSINKDIWIPVDEKDDFTTKGAAIIAGYGAKIYPSLEDGIKKIRTAYKVVRPDKNNRDFYNKKFLKFLEK
jgi:xylulokinase